MMHKKSYCFIFYISNIEKMEMYEKDDQKYILQKTSMSMFIGICF